MKTLLLLSILAFQSDWISTVTVPEEKAPPAVEQSAIEDLARLAMAHEDEIRALRTDLEELRQKQLNTKVTAPVDLSGILRDIAELKSRPAFTEAEIREFAKDEIAKFHAEVKLKDGSTQKIEAKNVQMSVTGYSGTFDVPEGAVITSIDGVPVSSTNGWTRVVNRAGRVSSVVGQTPNYNVRAVPLRNNSIRFFASPRSSGTCRIVNGVQVCN